MANDRRDELRVEAGPGLSTTIRNPATGAPAGQVRWTDPAEVPAIATALRSAQREWERGGANRRAQVLARFAVWLDAHRDEIERLLIAETGKSAVDAAQEVPLLIMIASYYVKTMEKALAPETRPAPLPFLSVKKIAVHYRPRAVVGVIAPWNFPVANAMMDALGALAGGVRGAAQTVGAHTADRRAAGARLARLGRRRCSPWPRRCP